MYGIWPSDAWKLFQLYSAFRVKQLLSSYYSTQMYKNTKREASESFARLGVLFRQPTGDEMTIYGGKAAYPRRHGGSIYYRNDPERITIAEGG